MNRIFDVIARTITYVCIALLVMPFLVIFKKGIPYILTNPIPDTIIFAIKMTMITSVVSTIITMICTFAICYCLAGKSQKTKSIYDYFFFLPMGIPHLVSGIALISFFGQHGIGYYLLKYLGIDFVYTPLGIVLAQFFINLPFSVKTLNESYNMIDEKMLFTAKTLGLNDSQVFIHVVLRMLKKSIIAITMMNWSRAVGEFGAVMMLVGVTSFKTETLATSVFLNMSTGDFDVAYGVSMILIAISLITTYLFHLLNKKGVDYFDIS